MNSLPRKFYERDTVIVAKELLGKRLVRKLGKTTISGIIIETEAYRNKDDSASHAFRRKTERNQAMFEEVGRAYVYFTYGMYFCFNVVARKPSVDAGAVLIRAIHPEKGIELMKKNRGRTSNRNLTDGPAKLTQAFDISKKHYGLDLTCNKELFISEGLNKQGKIICGPRIGISTALDNLWNFKIEI